MSNASFASAPHLFSFTPDDFARTEKYPFGNLVLPSCKILFLPTFLQCLQLREQNVGDIDLPGVCLSLFIAGAGQTRGHTRIASRSYL